MRGADIEMNGELWIYRPRQHKTAHHGRRREVALGEKSQEVIRPYLKTDLQAYLFDPHDAIAERNANAESPRRPNQRPTPRSTERKVGSRYETKSYRRAVLRTIKNLNAAADDENEIPEWTPHQLRHACATRIRKKYGLEMARVILGHSKVNMTEHYAAVDREKALEVAASVG